MGDGEGEGKRDFESELGALVGSFLVCLKKKPYKRRYADNYPSLMEEMLVIAQNIVQSVEIDPNKFDELKIRVQNFINSD